MLGSNEIFIYLAGKKFLYIVWARFRNDTRDAGFCLNLLQSKDR